MKEHIKQEITQNHLLNTLSIHVNALECENIMLRERLDLHDQILESIVDMLNPDKTNTGHEQNKSV